MRQRPLMEKDLFLGAQTMGGAHLWIVLGSRSYSQEQADEYCDEALFPVVYLKAIALQSFCN